MKVTAGDEAYWRGCYERRRVPDSDPDHWYTLESSWAHGPHEGFVGGLDSAYVANRYYKSSGNVQIIKQRPVTDLDVDDKCETRTLSLAPEGIGVTDEVRVCPDKIKLGGDEDSVYAKWDGWVSRDDDCVASAAMSYAHINSEISRIAMRLLAPVLALCVSSLLLGAQTNADAETNLTAKSAACTGGERARIALKPIDGEHSKVVGKIVDGTARENWRVRLEITHGPPRVAVVRSSSFLCGPSVTALHTFAPG